MKHSKTSNIPAVTNEQDHVRCPGCGLHAPVNHAAKYDGYYNTSPECWAVYTEVIGREFGNAVLFGAVHQLTVDTYAVQHVGGTHPDKSVGIHLAGLHLMFERAIKPVRIAPLLHRLANQIETWPHFPAPDNFGERTIQSVAQCDSIDDHIAAARTWANCVWRSWAPCHNDVAALVARYINLD